MCVRGYLQGSENGRVVTIAVKPCETVKSNWKQYKKSSSDNEMARNIARVKLQNDNSTVKLSFLFNSENSVIHSYLYNKQL